MEIRVTIMEVYITFLNFIQYNILSYLLNNYYLWIINKYILYINILNSSIAVFNLRNCVGTIKNSLFENSKFGGKGIIYQYCRYQFGFNNSNNRIILYYHFNIYICKNIYSNI